MTKQDRKKIYLCSDAVMVKTHFVKVICDGRDEYWGSRESALAYYTKQLETASQNKQKAYRRICDQLQAGFKICSEYPESKRKKESIKDEINADKFNYSNFSREDYEESNNSLKFDELIGYISIGKILIKLRKRTFNGILAEFYAIDEKGTYGKTSEGLYFDYAKKTSIIINETMRYDKLKKVLEKKLINYIDNFEAKSYNLWDKILHYPGERVYIEGEIKIGEYLIWVSSPATVLEEEFFHTAELYCRIDNVEGNIIEYSVPIRMFVSPFLNEYYEHMKKQENIFTLTKQEALDILPSSFACNDWYDKEELQLENLLESYPIPDICKEQLFKEYPSLMGQNTIFYIELSKNKYEQYVNTVAISGGKLFRNLGTGWCFVKQFPENQVLKEEEDKNV